MELNVSEIKKKIIPILRNYEVKKVALFGSCVKGQMREDSDVDVLIDIESDISLLEFVGIQQKMEEVLGRKVDLVEYSTLKPLLRERILKEQVTLL